MKKRSKRSIFRSMRNLVQSDHAKAVDAGKIAKNRTSLYSKSPDEVRKQMEWALDPSKSDIDEIDGARLYKNDDKHPKKSKKEERSKEKMPSQSQLDKMMR